jgi:hypothetical protein
MATSGNITFNLVASEMIQEALELLGVVGPGDSVSGEDYVSCLRSLNMMIKSWQSQGIHLWTEKEGTIFLQEGQTFYQLGNSSTDHSSTSYTSTTIGTAAISGATSLTLTTTSGMSAAQRIGIEVDDGTLHWTTIVSVDSSTTLTITTGLDAAAAVGNVVYVYTASNLIPRVLDISQARLYRDDGSTLVLQPLSRKEYFSLPNRTSTGNPIQYFVDYQKDNTNVYTYPIADDVTNRIEFTYKRIIEDFSAASNNADFPQEWTQTIIYNLAVVIAPKYHKEDKIQGAVGPLASQYLMGLKGYDQERTSLKFRPRIGK